MKKKIDKNKYKKALDFAYKIHFKQNRKGTGIPYFTHLVSVSNNIIEACNNIDLLIIHTEWEEFKALDFKKLFRKKKFKIYDMRNLYTPDSMRKKGISYYSVGR